MSWNDANELYIYMPENFEYEKDWENQILGNVIKPIIENYEDKLEWVWATSYIIPNNSNRLVSDHIYPSDYKENKYFYYLVVRFAAKTFNDYKYILEQIGKLSAKYHYYIPFEARIWSFMPDIGGDRFNRVDSGISERKHRSKLILEFMYSTLKLKIDSLIKQDDRWEEELNVDTIQNPDNSFFQSVHHLFCNVTQVKTPVLVRSDDWKVYFSTYISYSYNIESSCYLSDILDCKEPKFIDVMF